jgi:phage terminase large subunit GpA-like protein
MAHPMETTRIYLDDHQRGVVTCPHCGDTQALIWLGIQTPWAGQPATCSAGPVGAYFASSLMAVAISGSR